MATVVTTKKGKVVVLLNPAERSQKYARELREDRLWTNDMQHIKREGLTASEVGFRRGVLNERKKQAKIWKKKRK